MKNHRGISKTRRLKFRKKHAIEKDASDYAFKVGDTIFVNHDVYVITKDSLLGGECYATLTAHTSNTAQACITLRCWFPRSLEELKVCYEREDIFCIKYDELM